MIFGFIGHSIKSGPHEGEHTTIIRKDKAISICKEN
jgi:hypothetical protein